MFSVTPSYFFSRSSGQETETLSKWQYALQEIVPISLHTPATLTVLKQHVDCVEWRPANGEQQNDGDHHFNGSFLFPVGGKENLMTAGTDHNLTCYSRHNTNDGTLL